MVLSFCGVCTIAVSNKVLGEEDEQAAAIESDSVDVTYSTSMQILGAGLIFLTSWCYAIVSIVTR